MNSTTNPAQPPAQPTQGRRVGEMGVADKIAVAAAVTVGSLAFSGCAANDDSPDSQVTTESTASSDAPPSTSGPTTTSTPGVISTPPKTGSTPATSSTPNSLSPSDDQPPLGEDLPDSIDETVQGFVDDHQLNGAGLVLVTADDGVVAQQYWGEFGADRVSLIASSSKMITATVVLGLAGDGIVDLDAPISSVVDWGADYDDVALADLLSSTSGLVGLSPDPAYAPYVCQFLAEGTITECGAQIATTPDDDPDVAEPRTEFRYGGAQWQLAGAIAVDVSSKSWDELLDTYLKTPCGVESLGYTNHWAEFGAGFGYPSQFDGDVADLPVTDNPNMEGGAYINPIDYATLIQMHLNSGECRGQQPVPAALVERAHRDRLAEVGVSEDFGYGFGWWVDDDGSINDPGAYGSVGWFDPDTGYGAYLVIESSSTLGGELFDAIEPSIRSYFEQR